MRNRERQAMWKADKWNLRFSLKIEAVVKRWYPSTKLHYVISRQVNILKRDDPIIGLHRCWNAKKKVSPKLTIKLSLFLNTMPWRSMTESRPGSTLWPIYHKEKSLDIRWRRGWMGIGWHNYHVIINHVKLWNMFGLSARCPHSLLNEQYKAFTSWTASQSDLLSSFHNLSQEETDPEVGLCRFLLHPSHFTVQYHPPPFHSTLNNVCSQSEINT